MFKRSQAEEAIVKVGGPEPPQHEALLRNQIKRLLDTDRSLGRNKRSTDPVRANFAFYSDPCRARDMPICFPIMKPSHFSLPVPRSREADRRFERSRRRLRAHRP
jgi:hypothetical protein